MCSQFRSSSQISGATRRLDEPRREPSRYALATARVARACGEVTRRVCREVKLDACFTCEALLRVDLREGLPEAETSSAGPPLLFER